MLTRLPEKSVLTAYLALKREDIGAVRSYGAALRYAGEDYAIISHYFAEPVGTNEAIRQAVARIVDLKREGTQLVVVKSHEQRFLKGSHKFAQGIVTVPVKLWRLDPRASTHGAGVLAGDAYYRKTTIEEIL